MNFYLFSFNVAVIFLSSLCTSEPQSAYVPNFLQNRYGSLGSGGSSSGGSGVKTGYGGGGVKTGYGGGGVKTGYGGGYGGGQMNTGGVGVGGHVGYGGTGAGGHVGFGGGGVGGHVGLGGMGVGGGGGVNTGYSSGYGSGYTGMGGGGVGGHAGLGGMGVGGQVGYGGGGGGFGGHVGLGGMGAGGHVGLGGEGGGGAGLGGHVGLGGNLGFGGGGSGGVKTSGIKTSYVKTEGSGTGDGSSHTSSFVKTGQGFKGGCAAMPPPPMNAQLKCSHYSGCRATCIVKHQFPNGQNQLFITCKDGEWQVEGTEWATIPSCEPICNPACQNNGICMSPNVCHCPENFSGAQCQHETKPCLNYPPMPINARRSCSSSSCTITCMKGHQFPDGSSITNLMCKDGSWKPTREDWVTVPDCQATCNPPCKNGGNCLSFNVCQCPQEFRGPQCQYSANACKASKLKFNGGYNCSGSGDTFSCSVSCPEGIKFEFAPEHVYTCTYAQGKFLPEPIPQCVYGEDVSVIPLGGYSHTSYTGPNSSFSVDNMLVNGSKVDYTGGQFSYEIDTNGKGQYGVKHPSKQQNDSNIVNIPVGGSFGSSEGQDFGTETKPHEGSCFTWGGSHFKTFDGKVYSFNSPCAHTLVRDAIDNTFSIVIQNSEECSSKPHHCYKIVKIYQQDKEYVLKRTAHGIPIFTTGKKVLPVPGRVPGIRAEMSAHYIVILLDSIGAKIKWDGKQLVQVEVKESLWGRTAGLCGKIDGNADNDMLTKEDTKPKNVVTLASSWQVDSLGEVCKDIPTEEHVCEDTEVKGSKGSKALKFCKKLLSDKRFAPCHAVMDVNTLMDACRWDYCSCKGSDPKDCACETLNMYVRECAHKGITDLAEWRDEQTCPIQCTGGRVYKPCGPAGGQAVCGGASERPDEDVACEEGCYCPEGTVLHNSECITKESCPCMYRGKEYPPGSSIPKECNTCTCSEGKWVCTQVTCGARCSALGDPHYITFDGKRYDFMGQCTYYLVKHDSFTIEAENVACAGSISQAMNFPISVSSGLPSCTKTVIINTGGQTIKLKQNHEVSVNGQEITTIPFNIAGVSIRAVSSIFLIVELPNGAEIWWDGLTRVYIDLPPSFMGQTQGLCGTFNSNQKDDFLTPEGDVEHSPIPFANKWKTSEKCNNIPDVLKSHPCEVNIHNKAASEQHCKTIKSDLFLECHTEVDPEPFYQDCMYDVCSCETKLARCLCPMIAAYAEDCARRGIKVDWRNQVGECGMHCPGGQKYQICGNSCTRSCHHISTNSDCMQQCVEGCNCPEGEALDEHGECIPIGQCGCLYEGLEFPAGYKEVRAASKAPELCSCANAQWTCTPATPGEMIEYPKASDLKSKCSAAENKEFTTCEPVDPVTCKNMHAQELVSAAVCHAGCQCKNGYVLDTFSKTCVKPTECPCHHGGRSYNENAQVQNDCNTCKCKSGKWECTDNPCPGECSAWGDSHYKTFDGKLYDYQGQCDYILAKGVIGNEHSFDISIQNVPCGSLGVSCSKSVTIKAGSPPNQESITLTRDREIPEHATLKQLTVRQKGHYVIVEAPELGFIVKWDKGTRVYVKLNTAWKNKVKGLCGNYNDNEMDDFQTPSGGVTEVSPLLFGDSWRLQPYCPEALEVTDTCAQRPDRMVWALKQCGILKSSVFAGCHSEVPVETYLERCVFDTCACDQGGDCECLCTALAAYAQECTNRGIPIKWRTPDLCPMQCDERCAQYSPCVSTCPVETCDNMLVQAQLSQVCHQDSCIEGCQEKPCPPNFIYLNSSYLECVPRNICKPLCLEIKGVPYYEGDLIEEDACHSCYCSRGRKNCQGQPCPTTLEPITHQLTETVRCVSGWTEWVNQDKKAPSKASKKKLTDIEPVPGALVMNHLKEGGRCTIDNMVDIECRTVNTHFSTKETGLDVECSLESGLICRSSKGGRPCPDFEIRVKCACGKDALIATVATPSGPCDITKPVQAHPQDCYKFYHCTPGSYGPEFVEKTCGPHMMYNPKTMVCDFPNNVVEIRPECDSFETDLNAENEVGPLDCPDGEIYDDCGVECQRLCVYYYHTVKSSGRCKNNQVCDEGCVSANKKLTCPPGMFWANSHLCVDKKHCMCVSRDGKPVKPGELVYESDCEVCQCIDNFYTCDESACDEATGGSKGHGEKPRPGSEGGVGVTKVPGGVIDEEFGGKLVVPAGGVTPPPKCSEEDFIHLIDGELPLGDEAFSASTSSGKPFAPKNGRMSAALVGDSGGSWVPQISDKNQYLQINLGRQEPIYGIITKGSPLYDEYVTSYNVLYTTDGQTYTYVTDLTKQPKTFRGSMDANTPIKQLFDIPVEAQIIRINPQTWNTGIALRVELIGCNRVVSTTAATTVTTPQTYCVDPMGVDNGMMADQQVSVSSELQPHHTKKQVKPKSKFGWQPITNSPSEYIQFDFLEPRNITGFVSAGGPDGWVTAFNVKYSHNGKDWNPLVDKDKNERVLLGNVDENTPQVVAFGLPIQTKLLKIIPIKWHQNIQLRIEPHGCFEPYPTSAYTTTELPPSPCNTCPGAPSAEMELGACQCKEDLWWDGENCVARTQCPCMVGHIPYAIGTVFEKEDCSQCICKLGGISHCNPKACNKCEMGLRMTVTSSCNCICRPCEDGTTLCPTSNICINTTDWCNGVQDCPDDETGCAVLPDIPNLVEIFQPTPQPIKIEELESQKCPEPSCPPGYSVAQKKPSKYETTKTGLNTMFSTSSNKGSTKTSFRKVGTKTSTKGGQARVSVQKPQVTPEKIEEKEECEEFQCVSNVTTTHVPGRPGKVSCPDPTCPPGYTAEFDVYTKKKESCPRYECKPPPPVDAVCNVTGRTFNTFDLTEYKYEICNHVLARDLEEDQWEISLKKNCTDVCSRNLIIHHEDHVFVLHPDMSIEYDGYKYTVEQTKKIGTHSHFFAITRIGETLVFVSNKYGFWLIWDDQGNVKIGITTKLLGKVDGLCGYFNDNPKDDKRKPDGTPAKTTVEFGDSWAQADEPVSCETATCPVHIQNKAWEMCNLVKEHTFAPCHRVMDIDSFVSRCLETTCTCLEAAVGSKEAEEKCRCLALQSFVVDCLTTNSDLEVIDWRMKHDCPVACEAPLVHHDCYRRRCEPSCGALSDTNACPKLTHVCFPGCYCPPGYVRKGEECVLPTSCGDCECNVLPHLEYVTYDERNFTINGECVYVMSRDILGKKSKDHKFQVLISNAPCDDKVGKTCVGKVTIIHKGHTVEVVRDLLNGKLKLIVDSNRVVNFAEIAGWADVKEAPAKHLKIFLHKIQVKVSIYYPSLGVSVKAPSLKYGGKLEGLCGDCDGNDKDDLRTPQGDLTENVDDFGVSWLYDDLPGGQNKEHCGNEPEEQCDEVPVDSDPCIQLEDITKYGQCHPVLDPSMFIGWCKKDTCNGHPELSCDAIAAYSRECGHLGFCVDWHTKLCPAKECPADQEFRPCAPACSQTCEALKEKERKCTNAPVEGCFCPNGKVFLNGTCVVEERCEACDDEGHRSGDTWHKDACTKCSCEGTSVKCETQNCPSVETICEQGFNAVKVPTVDECCDKFMCVPAPTTGTTCEPPQQPRCGAGQVMKLITRPDHCQQFVCECKPLEDCDLIPAVQPPAKPGIVRETDESGCCPVIIEKCKIELCPKAPSCPKFHSVNKLPVAAGDCCPEYNCQAPKDKCIVDLAYTADEKGGERPRNEFEKQQVLKEADEKWQDGPCRECQCIVSPSGDYHDICTVAECPVLTQSIDHQDYVLEAQPVVGQCCATIKKVACKHNGQPYQVGEKWPVDGDPCTTIECIENTIGIQKVTQVASCDTKCDLGWEYKPASPYSKECCGSCKPVACVVDGIIHEVGDEWSSPDYCTNFFCVNLNGSIQVQSVVVICSELPEDVLDNYVVETEPVEGECCKKHSVIACKDGSTKYTVGETWPTPDGDVCGKVTCLTNMMGEIVKQETYESCNKNCSKGWEYTQSDTKCCGECAQVACVVGNELKSIGDSWKSPDGCITYICDHLGDQFTVITQQESCPNIDDCPLDSIYTVGCCKHCNVSSASQVKCAPEEMPLLKTIGLVASIRPPHGRCVNKEGLKGFTECVGTCQSSTSFNSQTNQHESICTCCQATKYSPLLVEFECEDGYHFKKQIAVPSKCSCEGCVSAKPSKGGSKTGTKTGIKTG